MKDVWVAGIATGHDASTCLLKNGELVFYIEEERLSRNKHDSNPFLSIDEIFKYTDHLDYLAVNNNTQYPDHINPFVIYCLKKKLIKNENQVFFLTGDREEHHLYHASNAFYASGFKESICVVVDALGAYKYFSDNAHGSEVESVYHASYPHTFKPIFKRLFNYKSLCQEYASDKVEVVNKPSIGVLYSETSVQLGFSTLDCGKVMGLSSYGSKLVDIDYQEYPSAPSRCIINNIHEHSREDFSYTVQSISQNYCLDLIKKGIEKTGCKNVTFSGGYGLNCVANYFYRKNLPADVNLYVDPLSYDGGASIGVAKYAYHLLYKDTVIRKQTSLYTGTNSFTYHDGQDVSYEDIVTLLTSGEIVAMFQGRSEAGPRALGNRSILFDPRVKNGKDIVNTVKGREFFRPFAATILKEECHDWFDMAGLDESPFMMYAVDAKQDKKHLMPSVVHVDGTCRVQTVTENQNYHFYNLIKSFKNQTGVPLLFNTSFNLAGDAIVETIQQAIETLKRSDIKYLYLPEHQKLITIEGKHDN
jgi:carbamoyltransferase